MVVSDRPARRVLTATVARRYYLQGKSKVEIAEELGLSRFQVARMLEEAKASGLVRIEVTDTGGVDDELSSRLRDAFGLRHAIVVDVPDSTPTAVLGELGGAAAALLTEIVTPEDVLGLAWARSVSAMTVALRQLPRIPVVQLTGALPQLGVEDNSVDLVRHAARVSGGAAYFFYAPTIVSDPVTAHALRRQPEVVRAFDQFKTITKAVVGIGLWAPRESTVYDATDETTRTALDHKGVHSEVSGVLLDIDGRPVASEMIERIIGISADELCAIPEVIAIAYNSRRTPALRAAIRGGVVNSIVTHPSFARSLLSEQSVQPDEQQRE